MKKILFILLLSVNNILSAQEKIQTLTRVFSEFYSAYNNYDNYNATVKGDSLLMLFDDLKLPLDTIVATSRIDVGLAYYDFGNYQKALEIDLKSMELFSKIWPKSNSRFLLLLNRLAWDYYSLGNFSNSNSYFTEINKLNINLYGYYHAYSASTFNNLTVINNELGNYNEAIKNGEAALEIYQKLYGENNVESLNCLSNIAMSYNYLNDYKKALQLNEQVLTKRKLVVGDKHPDYILSMNNLAENQYRIGLYNESKKNFLECIKIQSEQFGRDNNQYIQYLSNYSILMEDLGFVDSSLLMNRICLDLTRKINGSKHALYINRLNNFGSSLLKSGNLSLAKLYFDSAYVLSKSLRGLEHPTTIQCLQNIAATHGHLGDYSKAIDIEISCLNLIAESRGKLNLEYASGLHQLAFYDSKLGLDSLALKWNKEAYEIRKEILGPKHPSTLTSALNLAADYSKINNFDKSLQILNEVLKYRIEIFGVNSPETKIVYNNIGLVYFDLKDYNKALANLLKTYNEGDDYQDMDASLINISSTYEKLNQIDKAIFYQEKVVKWYSEDYFKNQLFLSEEDKSNYKNKLDFYVSYLVYLNHKNEFKNSELSWYEYYISAKNLINNQNRIESLPMSQNELDNLKNVSNQIKILKAQKNKAIEFGDNINATALQLEIEKSEIQYSSKIGGFFQKPIDLKMIEYKLSSSETVFLDIIPYKDQQVDKNLFVTVLTSKSGVLIIPFDTRLDLEGSIFDQYKQEATDSEQKTDLKSEKFYNYFWKPIADKIGDAKTIYVSLGGVYNNINLNTIYNPTTGKYLLEEKDIRIVNSARDFVLSKEREKKNYSSNTASLFGFPNFDGNTTVSADTSDLFASTRDLNSFWLDSLTRGGMKAKPLPATKTEVENISTTLKSKDWQVNSFLADNASETNIKKQQSPRILHVATHGYFFQDIPMEKDNNRFLGMDRQQVVQDPMLRSGLLLTGANKTLKGETTTGENGLLSAAEASLLDLRETKLVILSACETGKGEVKNSEGVYGLRKAFSDAGAQNIIMSLWKVDDKVTQEFMSRFYEIWLNDKTSIREAFNKTQLEIKAKYPQPYYWGAFILVGE